MKVFVGVLMLCLAVSEAQRPGRGGRGRPGRGRPGKFQQKAKEDPGTILRCMAENYQAGEEQIKACRQCFQDAGDVMSAEGLPKAKECAATYLPLESAACASIIQEMTPGDEEKIEEVVECFDETLKSQNYERCVSESNSVETVVKLTDGAMCVLESWKYSMEYVKNSTRSGLGAGGRWRGRGRGGRGKGRGKGMKMKMLMMAHCQNANEDDETREEECRTCFNTAVRSGMRRPRSGRKDSNSKELVKAAMLNCSQQYLTPKYDSCSTLMATDMADGEANDKEQVMGCYMRVLVGDIVADCSTDVTEASADSLGKVMDCGKETVAEFVKENANPKMLEKLGKMFGKDDDDDDDE